MVAIWSYLAVFGLSMLPIFELKGSIPVGMSIGIPDFQCFIIAELGCIALTPLIIMFTKRILEAFMNSKIKLLHIRRMAAQTSLLPGRQDRQIQGMVFVYIRCDTASYNGSVVGVYDSGII